MPDVDAWAGTAPTMRHPISGARRDNISVIQRRCEQTPAFAVTPQLYCSWSLDYLTEDVQVLGGRLTQFITPLGENSFVSLALFIERHKRIEQPAGRQTLDRRGRREVEHLG